MNRTLANLALAACRISITGTVQGVGFRPFVYRAATRYHVTGWVLNGEAGVEIYAEGPSTELNAFLTELNVNPPPAARIEHVHVLPVKPEGCRHFEIRESAAKNTPTVRISPDLAVCADCLQELNDPGDRRYHYPYINCTNCGPRYSIIRQLPYDRPVTTMADWPLCEQCQREFDDPADRRFHAQPIACPSCGPQYVLQSVSQLSSRGEQALRSAAKLLAAGQIVAIKGTGGYHLACDAHNLSAVAALRTRKFRKEKPFAVMVRTISEARQLIDLTRAHQELLEDNARPIVIATAKCVLPEVSLGNATLGVMLPYTPLHDLLFQYGAPSPLVLTSANRSSEPIPYRDEDALERLAGIADAFLIGERPIARRVDDSVAAVSHNGRPQIIRRSRGYAPGVVCSLPTTHPILALGSDLKNTLALVVDGDVLVSQHIGDLGDREANLAFEETVNDLLAMYQIDHRELTVVHDLHPQFVSTRFAKTCPARRRIAVQHHRAHVASVLAEHRLFDERVLGVALDGTGYGDDGSIWGCEFFVGSLRTGLERRRWLRPLAMPGGDAAARFPVQAAAGFLAELPSLPEMSAEPFRFPPQFQHARCLIEKNFRCFNCSSAGRLFDAVAALLGFTRETTFEGQAAIWLEQLALRAIRQRPYPFPDLDHRPMFEALLRDRLTGRPVEEIAAAFHASFSAAIAAEIRCLCKTDGLQIVALSGGVFQNQLLWQLLEDALAADSQLRLVTNERVPVNDGGISLGQAALATLFDAATSMNGGISFASVSKSVSDIAVSS